MNPAPPQVLAIMRMLIEERTGLRYGEDDAALIEDKVLGRANVAGFDSLLDYYYYLRYDPNSSAEFNELVDALVVNETYFFREAPALGVMVDEILSKVVATSGRARVWSAACSTGEEPFTLAMLLAERGMLDKVTLLGSDISERALAQARAGKFRGRSVRTEVLPSAATGRLSSSSGPPQLIPEIRNSVEFRKLNLLDAEQVKALGRFDVILCRNVLIYFADETVQQVVGTLAEALNPGGVLLVGTCESLLRHSTVLSCEELRGIFFYRKAQ